MTSKTNKDNQALEQAFDKTVGVFGKERLAKAIVAKTYAVGDTVEYLGKQYKIVDALENGDYHLKNLAEPFDSFLTVLPKE